MFCIVGKPRMHWKRIRIVSSSVCYLYTIHGRIHGRIHFYIPCQNTCYCVTVTCVCACHYILNCVYVLKRRNTMWLGSKTCAWLARLFGTTSNEEEFKERTIHAQSVCACVPMPECNCVCARTCCMGVYMLWHCSNMLSCPYLRLKTASSLNWYSPMCLLTQNTC